MASPAKKLNQFCPPWNSDDLFLLFCILPSSMTGIHSGDHLLQSFFIVSTKEGRIRRGKNLCTYVHTVARTRWQVHQQKRQQCSIFTSDEDFRLCPELLQYNTMILQRPRRCRTQTLDRCLSSLGMLHQCMLVDILTSCCRSYLELSFILDYLVWQYSLTEPICPIHFCVRWIL